MLAIYTMLSLQNHTDGFVWVGFGMSYPYGQGALRDFDKRAAMEVRIWESLFAKRRPRLRKQKAKRIAGCQ
jgi:hypothetical protein